MRELPAVLRRVRVANNVCPICWMPMRIEDEPSDVLSRWTVAQIIFKGKPAFSVMNPDNSSQTSRPVLSFGIVDVIPHKAGACNYDKCHYVHYAQFGTQCDVRNLWFGERINTDSSLAIRELPTGVNALNLFRLVSETEGIFSAAAAGSMKTLLDGLYD